MAANGKASQNVLLVSLDNVRYDCVSCIKDRPHLKRFYLDGLVDTPTIDEIASDCAVFSNCFSTSSYTTSAHASLFTGLLPPEHGVRPFYYKALNGKSATIAELYKKNGYKTVFYSDVIELFYPIGLTRGFDFIFSADISELFKQLDLFKDEKVFCFIHLFDAHEPYIFSQNYSENGYNEEYFSYINNMRTLYRFPDAGSDAFALWNAFSNKTGFNAHILLPAYIRGINKFDKGRLALIYRTLKKIGYFKEDDIYAVFADHGEGRISFFDMPVFGHMGELFDEVIRVPLFFHAPAFQKGVYDNLVSLADIFSALVSLSGLADGEYKEYGSFLFKEREYCYAEYCTQNIYNEVVQFLSSGYDRAMAGASSEDRYFLSQRAIRTRDKKYMFIPENAPAAEAEKLIKNKNISEENFIFEIFNAVARKRISRQEFLFFLDGLKSGRFTRQSIYSGMVSSEIYHRPKNYYFDLKNDPMEEMPVALNPATADAIKWIHVLNGIESRAVSTGDLFKENVQENAPAGGAARAAIIGEKAALSIEIIREAFSRFGDKAGIAFTGGKDSTVLLDLAVKAFGGKIPFKVITVDTSAEFPEIRRFMERLSGKWGFELLTYSNLEALRGGYPVAEDKADCCNTLKTAPLKKSIKELHLKAMLTGIRRDENEARAEEKYFSKRENPHHFRVHPILHFTENDVWEYIKLNDIPYCPLYEEGYRSIDCAPCTQKTPKEGAEERSGRSEEKEAAMEKLRKLGYF